MSQNPQTIVYTLTDEAPLLATASFLPIIRTFAPILAGVIAIDFKKFMVYNVVGAVLVFLIFIVAASEIAIAIPIVLLLVRQGRTLDAGAYTQLKG